MRDCLLLREGAISAAVKGRRAGEEEGGTGEEWLGQRKRQAPGTKVSDSLAPLFISGDCSVRAEDTRRERGGPEER